MTAGMGAGAMDSVQGLSPRARLGAGAVRSRACGSLLASLVGLTLAACSSDSRPPAPVSGVGMDEDPALTEDGGATGGDADGGSSAGDAAMNGVGPALDAGPRPDAPPGSAPSLRRLVVADPAGGAVLVFDLRGSTELPAPVRLDAPKGARVVAGPSGRYAYVFAPGGTTVQVLDVGLHADAGGQLVAVPPAYLDSELHGHGVLSVVAGTPGGSGPDVAVAFSGESAALFVSEADLAKATSAADLAAGEQAHQGLAFFVGELPVRSVADGSGTRLETVAASPEVLCTSPASMGASHGPHALVACGDGVHLLTRSAAGLENATVGEATELQLAAAGDQSYGFVASGELAARPFTPSAKAPGFAVTLAARAVALSLGRAEKVGVWLLDATGALQSYSGGSQASSAIATGCVTGTDGASPGLFVESELAFYSCPSAGTVVLQPTDLVLGQPVVAQVGGTPSDLVVFGYAR